MTCIGVVYVVMAYIVMTCIGVFYVGIASVVMAYVSEASVGSLLRTAQSDRTASCLSTVIGGLGPKK